MDREIHTFANGIRVFKDRLIDVQIARYAHCNIHEPVEEKWFEQLCKPSAGSDSFSFVDIGAAVGYYAVLVKKLRPNAAVICVEPLSANSSAIREHLLLNGIESDDVTILEMAVSDRKGYATLLSNNYSSYLIDDTVAGSRDNAVTVSVDTLAELIRARVGQVDLVKVDVQGEEVKVLDGAAAISSNIKAWIVGTHSEELHAACIKKLLNLGYSMLFEDQHPPGQPDGIVVASRAPDVLV